MDVTKQLPLSFTKNIVDVSNNPNTENNKHTENTNKNVRFLTKYKPTSINEFGLNANIKLFIEKIIIPDGVSFILVGSSGSGKTVLTNYVIQQHYAQFNSKNDVLVINSLSETGINFYKYDLKSFCQSKCYGKNGKKIVLIEDVETLNDTIYDVITSYIDEYKENVMFIQTTTSIEKMKNKVSCFTININPLSKEALYEKYTEIKLKEELNISSDCDAVILSLCNRSVKRLLNILEKIKILNVEITKDNVFSVCSNINYYHFERFTCNILDDKPSEALNEIICYTNDGYSTSDVLYYYYYYIKELSSLPLERKLCIIKVISRYIGIVSNVNEGDHFIIAFVDAIMSELTI